MPRRSAQSKVALVLKPSLVEGLMDLLRNIIILLIAQPGKIVAKSLLA